MEPTTKRAIAFFDGQNLFFAAKAAFGYGYANFDAPALARLVCVRQGWSLAAVRFYTGLPNQRVDPFWSHFWTAKLAQMGREGVYTFSRTLRYRSQVIQLPDGTMGPGRVPQEKGIDIRIALDVVRLAHENLYDVGVIFSQDQDLSEAADEVRVVAREQHRWIKLASAFPTGKTTNRRGINSTDWIQIDRASYDTCLDERDYRPKKGRGR
jgi:uncharacterized LabA/DUF88 family protein